MSATLAPVAPTENDYTSFYESIYVEAHGDQSVIPWGNGAANPALIAWLNVVAPSLIRCGSRVCVIGCGLGEDTRELIHRGFDVTAFDISSAAIDWARSLDSANEACYHVSDLFDSSPRWRHRFDLVVECYTVQSLPPSMWVRAFKAMRELMSPHGYLLVIARGALEEPPLESGPPWPITRTVLMDAAREAGLSLHGHVDQFEDDEVPPVMRLRSTFMHSPHQSA